MNGPLRLPLNLATRPLRNRRLFRTVAGCLVVLFLLSGGAAAYFLVRSAGRAKADARVSADLELRIQAAGKERAEKEGLAKESIKQNSVLAAEVNTAIARKNFSWVEFFALLEEALPPDCSLAAVNALELSGPGLHVSMRVITPDLPRLLTLIENLSSRRFYGVTMKNETAGGGRLISEIGFDYDGSR
ncbi:MAG: hypothetical protein JW843_07290 [Candidatus Aminicenantes bacterium]|nr:hypothetical protein [Candidatus Aminicenantes bacterium]